jgi:hypothetical protein
MIQANEVFNSNYERDKYIQWKNTGFTARQDQDPSFVRCSYCKRRTHNLGLVSNGGRDYLICSLHPEFSQFEKGEQL